LVVVLLLLVLLLSTRPSKLHLLLGLIMHEQPVPSQLLQHPLLLLGLQVSCLACWLLAPAAVTITGLPAGAAAAPSNAVCTQLQLLAPHLTCLLLLLLLLSRQLLHKRFSKLHLMCLLLLLLLLLSQQLLNSTSARCTQ
jgi:hypothetical protein